MTKTWWGILLVLHIFLVFDFVVCPLSSDEQNLNTLLNDLNFPQSDSNCCKAAPPGCGLAGITTGNVLEINIDNTIPTYCFNGTLSLNKHYLFPGLKSLTIKSQPGIKGKLSIQGGNLGASYYTRVVDIEGVGLDEFHMDSVFTANVSITISGNNDLTNIVIVTLNSTALSISTPGQVSINNNPKLDTLSVSNISSIGVITMHGNKFSKFSDIPSYFSNIAWSNTWDFNFNNWDCSNVNSNCTAAGKCNLCCSNVGNCASTEHVASKSCTGNTCRIDSCAQFYGNCNNNYADGCEQYNNTYFPSNFTCGFCAPQDCSQLPNVGFTSCVNDACYINTCSISNLWGNCDSNVTNGCERNVTTVQDCGGCGVVCQTPTNSNPICQFNSGYSCGYECTDTNYNCNSLGNELTLGCNTHYNGAASHSNETCVSLGESQGCRKASGCYVNVQCNEGLQFCTSYCQDITADVDNCGSCGYKCCETEANCEHVQTPSCSNQTCVYSCKSGYAECIGNDVFGCETDINNSNTHCGACNTPCTGSYPDSTTGCASGLCITTCVGNKYNCDGSFSSNGCEYTPAYESFLYTSNVEYGTFPIGIDNSTFSCLNSSISQVTFQCTFNHSNCDELASNGCEVNLLTDKNHCGTCATQCPEYTNAETLCVDGICISTCNSNYYDCDNDFVSNGCESNIQNPAATTTVPANYMCWKASTKIMTMPGDRVYFPCPAGYQNCDYNFEDPGANHCNYSTASDPTHCGTCWNNCSATTYTNATAACVNSECAINCISPYLDCNEAIGDGCEVNPTTNIDNCGTCNHTCANITNAQRTCSASNCSYECYGGFTDCDGSVENGCEAQLVNDVLNCGTCGNKCNTDDAGTDYRCTNYNCEFNCLGNYQNCDEDPGNGCEVNLATNPFYCSACNVSCYQQHVLSATCLTSVCHIVCEPNFGDCDYDPATGCETDKSSTVEHCGACDFSCSARGNVQSATCESSQCVFVCDATFGNCDGIGATGCETSLPYNTDHCGACNHSCTALPNVGSAHCYENACVIDSCLPGFSDCDLNPETGCEVNLSNDPLHCKTCNISCYKSNVVSADCIYTACHINQCETDFVDCDLDPSTGCEVDISSNVNHCGSCSLNCTAQASNVEYVDCQSKQCVVICSTNFDNCDGIGANGCETSLPNTTNHCGACNNSCTALPNVVSAHCYENACVIDTCAPGYGDCDSFNENGCETDTSLNIVYCGSCNNSCNPLNETCAGGTCIDICSCTLPILHLNSSKSFNCDQNGCIVANGEEDCIPGYGNCDGQGSNGCESELITTTHCGSCANTCPNQKNEGTTVCINSECKIDCGGGELLGTVNHCSSCTDNCDAKNNVNVTHCSNSECVIDECDNGWCNYDTLPGTGCEISISSPFFCAPNCTSAPINCVSLTNVASALCTQGICEIVDCVPDFEDCNGDPTDGCEADLVNDLATCGGCYACPLAKIPHTQPVCINGTCDTQCIDNYSKCKADTCIYDLSNDVYNCGECDNSCYETNVNTAYCYESKCTNITYCSPDTASCDNGPGCEVDITTTANCGGCGIICNNSGLAEHEYVACIDHECTNLCTPGYISCNGVCDHLNSDTQCGCDNITCNAVESCDLTGQCTHCGSVNTYCDEFIGCSGSLHLNAMCILNVCQFECQQGWLNCNTDCNDCSTNITTITHCGSCENDCTAVQMQNANVDCDNGICSYTCNPNWRTCNQPYICDIDASNPEYCNSCTKNCTVGMVNANADCLNNECFYSCITGWQSCGIDPKVCDIEYYNISHCGDCNNDCNDGAIHSIAICTEYGECSYECEPGWDNCGTEAKVCSTELNTTTEHCGSCSTNCSVTADNVDSSSCIDGKCSYTCNEGWKNCDTQKGICTTDITSDVDHCGSCDHSCSAAYSEALNVNHFTCTNSTCGIVCDQSYDNCNGILSDGCEVYLSTNNANCGVCNLSCLALAHVDDTSNCSDGVCMFGCDQGYEDCNKEWQDGCEHDKSNNQDCGVCGDRINCTALSNINPTQNILCVEDKCTFSCLDGYYDCDFDPTNGCEVYSDFNSDTSHCGGCDNSCDQPNTSFICVDGECVISSCKFLYGDCNKNAKDGCEMSLANDPLHCKYCDTNCYTQFPNADVSCSQTGCEFQSCYSGYGDCTDALGCETNFNTSLDHCGRCNNSCIDEFISNTCVLGVCVFSNCIPPFISCDVYPEPCVVNPTNDVNNCGGCGITCIGVINAVQQCVGSECGYSECNAEYYKDCDGLKENGCEVDIRTDDHNCGDCSSKCLLNDIPNSAALQCSNSTCKIIDCDKGFGDCDGNVKNGCETNIKSIDKSNCGGCNISCSGLAHVSKSVCTTGICTIQCQDGYLDCDNNPFTGCETAISETNCGECGTNCYQLKNVSSVSCQFGVADARYKCIINNCTLPYGNCDFIATNGCETLLENNNERCGSCSNNCTTLNASNAVIGCKGMGCEIIECSPSTYGNCDGINYNGCEVDLMTNASHCQSCNQSCVYPDGGSAKCYQGECYICQSGYRDCDNDVGNGCEVNIQNDTINCGVCNHECKFTPLPNMETICYQGVCQQVCISGFANCDNDESNGCEVNIDFDSNRCGGCKLPCLAPDGMFLYCEYRTCTLCPAGYADCDNNGMNGCEVNILNDTSNCGSCVGSPCKSLSPSLHAESSCVAGVCSYSCLEGYLDCDGNTSNGCEVNGLYDNDHCGSCIDHVCGNGSYCDNGSCVSCSMGFGNCDNDISNGCETYVGNNVDNCGLCGNQCIVKFPNLVNGIAICEEGVCKAKCNEGYGDCTSGNIRCETNFMTNVNHCGNCSTTCSPVPIGGSAECKGGVCFVCNAGYADCDNNVTNSCEVNILSDPKNCGGCGQSCRVIGANQDTTCTAGICGATCTPTYANCNNNSRDGCETNLLSNTSCGSCNNDCTKLLGIVSAQCSPTTMTCNITCQPNLRQCPGGTAGCTTRINNDTRNCGECGNDCTSLPNVSQTSCKDGGCQITLCKKGFANCNGEVKDGCEEMITSSKENCGVCGLNCKSLNNTNSEKVECISSECVLACKDQYGDCDFSVLNGCETNLQTSVEYCGGCSTNCTLLFTSKNIEMSSIECKNGTCTFSACSNQTFLDCNHDLIDGCETNQEISISNCGGCGNNCASLPNSKKVTCSQSTCQLQECNLSYANCNGKIEDGCEVKLNDIQHCGSCDHDCTTLPFIEVVDCIEVDSKCMIKECEIEHADCNGEVEDGCEVSLSSDLDHCGACYHQCQALPNVVSTSCIQSECIINECSSQFEDCNQKLIDGCESDRSTFPPECGRCGECGSDVLPSSVLQAQCLIQTVGGQRNGSCIILRCEEGLQDCNEIADDGCETLTSSIPVGCGPCGIFCVPPPPLPSSLPDNGNGNDDGDNNSTTTDTGSGNNGSSGNNGGNGGNGSPVTQTTPPPPPVDNVGGGIDQQVTSATPRPNQPPQIDASNQIVYTNEVVVAYNPNQLIPASTTSSSSSSSSTSVVVQSIDAPIPPPSQTKILSAVTSIILVDSSTNSTSSGTSVTLAQPIQICFVLNTTVDSKSENDACLAYVDTKTNEWVCEDNCLSYSSSSDNGTTWACGKSGHLTDFTVLFGGLARGGKCGDKSEYYMLGSLESDSILIGSVAGGVILCGIIIVILYVCTPLEGILVGKEGMRIKKVRSKRTTIDPDDAPSVSV